MKTFRLDPTVGDRSTAYPDLEAADVRAVISRYRPRRKRDRNFAVAGNFERIDHDSRPISEIPDDAADGPRG